MMARFPRSASAFDQPSVSCRNAAIQHPAAPGKGWRRTSETAEKVTLELVRMRAI